MLSIENILAYLEKSIASEHLAGDRDALRQSQLVAGYLMRIAEQVHDRETAARLRALAGRSANLQERLEQE